MTYPHAETMNPHHDLLDTFLAHLRAEAAGDTYRTYAPVLIRAQRDLPHGVAAATEDELRGWLWGRSRPLSDQTLATYLGAFRRLHLWLVKRGISDYDPTELLPRPKVPRGLPRPVPPDQLRILLTETRLPVRTWITIAAYSGARCVEIARLDRVDITEQTVQLHGKGNKHRIVPTHPALWAAVADLPPGPIAPTQSHDPAKRVSDYIAREIRRVGPDWRPRVTAHRLRHTIATQVLTQTGDLRLVQELLGHASPATTAIYTRVTPSRMSAAVAAVPDWGTTGSPADAGPG